MKVVLSSNNKFFIAITIDNKLNLFINEHFTNTLLNTKCHANEGASIKYKLYYFEETKEFILATRYAVALYIINSYNNFARMCNKNYFPEQTDYYDFNIIYNSSINNYSLINHLNFENEVQNITNQISYF